MREEMAAAVQAGNLEVVRALVARGYSLSPAPLRPRDDVIHVAARAGNAVMCEILLGVEGMLEYEGDRSCTPLLRAVESGDLATVCVFLSAGADATGLGPTTPLHLAMFQSDVGIAEALIQADAGLDAIDDSNQSALHCAAIQGRDDLCEMLIKAGAEMNTNGPQGRTPLHLAASAGRLSTCRLLIQNGADAFERDEAGQIPLACDITVESDDRDAVDRLLEEVRSSGPNYVIDGATDKYLTPFEHAIWRWDTAYVRDVLESYPTLDLSRRTLGGKTLDELAANNAELTRLLMSARTKQQVEEGLNCSLPIELDGAPSVRKSSTPSPI